MSPPDNMLPDKPKTGQPAVDELPLDDLPIDEHSMEGPGDNEPGADEIAGTEVRGGGRDDAPVRAKKAPNAFRTISEVADELHIPQHVLRFWETKFPQIKPLKRGGGRRYYRPDDILLLRRISDLLYIQGYTIKGVQRLLRDGGGQLSEDIPPATPAERAAAEVEQAAVDVLPPPEALSPGPSPDALEAARLRALLRHALDELVALRAMLD